MSDEVRYKKLRDPDQTSSALNTLAGINLAANHPRQAEKHILQALRYASRANNPPRQAVINGMASEIYYKLGNYHLTSSLRHPKILIKEFSYFLMPCHQHGLRINLLV